MSLKDTTYNTTGGFTLVELSIVLVIIGLIVGGILVGRDLIRASEVRSSVSQLEKLDTAVNAFRLKYEALPGDISAEQAAAFGMAVRAGTLVP
jgi:prepilin-type N-terminal cleavage/methylation domain-containing protein